MNEESNYNEIVKEILKEIDSTKEEIRKQHFKLKTLELELKEIIKECEGIEVNGNA